MLEGSYSCHSWLGDLGWEMPVVSRESEQREVSSASSAQTVQVTRVAPATHT